MKRDMEVIRELLLRLENLHVAPGGAILISPSDPRLAIEGITSEDVAAHLHMLVSGSLVETAGNVTFTHDNSLAFRQLSWTGCDFLDSVRDPDVWSKTKQGAAAAGGFTVDLLKDLAKGFLKKQIEERTGIKL